MKKYLLIILGMFLFLSEIILQFSPELGVILYSVLIGGCLIALANEEMDNHGKLLIVFTILPIIRISELFVRFEFMWRSFIVYYILVFLVLFYSLKFKINPGYTKKKLYLLPIVILVALLFGLFINNIFDLDKYFSFIFLLPVLAFSEEILFRGLIQNLTEKTYGELASILFTSILYAVFSLSYGFPFVLIMFIFSLISCLIYSYSKNIYLTMVFSLIFHFFVLVW